MADHIYNTLPDGFVVDTPESAGGRVYDTLPDGFEVDSPTPVTRDRRGDFGGREPRPKIDQYTTDPIKIGDAWYAKRKKSGIVFKLDPDTGEQSAPTNDSNILQQFGQDQPTKTAQQVIDWNKKNAPADEIKNGGDAGGSTIAKTPEKPSAQLTREGPEPTDYGSEFMNSLVRTGGGQNMELSGHTLKAVGEATGDDTFSNDADQLIAMGQRAQSGVRQPKMQEFLKVRSLGDAWNYAQQTVGQAIGSSIVPLVGGGVGGFMGGELGGKPGAAVGAVGGAFLGSAMLNVGSMRQELIKQGVTDPKLRGKVSIAGGAVMSALDSLLPGEIAGKFTGGVRREVEKAIIKRILKGAAHGAFKEGWTEGAQQAIQDVGADLTAGTNIDGKEFGRILDDVFENVMAGALGGGVMSGATEAMPLPGHDDTELKAGVDAEKRRREAQATTHRGPSIEVTLKDGTTTGPRPVQADEGAAPPPGQAPWAPGSRALETLPEGFTVDQEPIPPIHSAEIAPSKTAEPAQSDEKLSKSDEKLPVQVPDSTPQAPSERLPEGFVVEGSRAAPAEVSAGADIETARAQVAEPTEAQAEAGNYRKGHVTIHGLNVTIETPKRGERRGVGPDGKPWSVTMRDDYGYIRRSEGADGEHVDVFIGPNPQSDKVFVVDQKDLATGKFDEHKVVMGSKSATGARAIYERAFSDSKAASRIGGITEMSVPEFKAWLAKPQTKPAATISKTEKVEPVAASTPVSESTQKPIKSETPPVVTPEQEKAVKAYIAGSGRLTAEAMAEATKTEVPEASRLLSHALGKGWIRQIRPRALKDGKVKPGKLIRLPRTDRPRSLMEFLAENGGIRDQGGELKARDLHTRMIPGQGRLVRKDGMTLDEARGLAVEAGYLEDTGRRSGGESQTTIQDLLDAIDKESHGEKIVTREDQAKAQEMEAEAKAKAGEKELADRYSPTERAFIEKHGFSAFEAIDLTLYRHGMVWSDWKAADLAKIATLINNENMSAENALERVALESERAEDVDLANQEEGDIVPFDEVFPRPASESGSRVRESRAESEGPGAEEAHGRERAPPEKSGKTGKPAGERGQKTPVKEPKSKPETAADLDALKSYAKGIVGGPVAKVTLVGSMAAKGTGRDVDLLYELRGITLPENSEEAAAHLEEIAQGIDGADYESHDTFFKVGERYFHLGEGAGRGLVENTDYARDQAGKPQIVLAEAPENVPVKSEKTGAGEQTVVPGAEQISQREQAQRKSDEKLKAKTEQKPMESGLFGDGHNQTDLLDHFRGDDETSPTSDYAHLGEFTPQSAETVGTDARGYVLRQGKAHNAEAIVAIDRDGRILADGRGPDGGKTVGPSTAQTKAQDDPTQEIVVHHNHPGGSSLSVADIAMLAKPGNAAIWVHTQAGSYRAALNPGLRSIHSGRLINLLYTQIHSWTGAVYDTLQAKVNEGTLDASDAQHQYVHFRNVALQRAGIIHYFTDAEIEASPDVEHAIGRSVDTIRKDFADGNIPLGGYARTVRYPGDMGILPERTPGVDADRVHQTSHPGRGRRDRGPQGGPETGFEQDGVGAPPSRFEEDRGPVFYSGLLRTVENLKQPKAPAAQWLATIRHAPGVKKEELNWIGLEDWLKAQPGPVTREALANFIRANKITVNEVTLNSKLDKPTKFDTYTLPGGENYRELLLTLPPPHVDDTLEMETGNQIAGFNRRMREKYGERYAVKLNAAEQNESSRLERENIAAATARQREQDQAQFRTKHFDQPNILAHVRFNQRTDADGKKVLFIEEIQSDWHQKGRKQGYRSAAETQKALEQKNTLEAQYTELRGPVREMVERNNLLGFDTNGQARRALMNDPPSNWEFDTPEDAALAQRFHDAWQAFNIARRNVDDENNVQNQVPDAPFKTSWPELAMKRMIRWAAQNGFDRIAWTPGDVQADRYNLRKYIDNIFYSKDPGGLYSFNASKGGITIMAKERVTLDVVADTIGKEMADKFAKGEGESIGVSGAKELSGIQLEVGGEGMRSFYDKELVNTANKLGKKFGVKVGETKISAAGGKPTAHADFDAYVKAQKEPIAVPALDLTPEMRAAAMRGQPLFQLGKVSKYAFVITPRQRAEVIDGLQKVAQRILGRRIPIEVVDRINAKLDQGNYNPNTQSIIIALRDALSPFETLGHEAIHALRDLGLLSDQEWSVLKDWAQKDLLPNSNIRELYTDLYRERFDVTNDQLEDLLIEEAVAEAFRSYVEGNLKGKAPRPLLAKIRNFLEALRNMLRGMGFQTPDDIFESIDRGEMTARQEGQNTRGFELNQREQGALAHKRPRTPLTSTSAQVPPTDAPLQYFNDRSMPLFARAGTAAEMSYWRSRYFLQDRFKVVERIQKAIAEKRQDPIPELWDAYTRESLYYGRTGERLEAIRRDFAEPLVDEMVDRGVTMDELGRFLYARHAAERNARIAEINPEMPDGGSGMTDAQAARIMEGFRHSRKTADLENLAGIVDDLNDKTRKLLLHSGLISAETYQSWNNYNFYVPLRGYENNPDGEETPNSEGNGTGQRFDIRGKESKRALGRASLSDNPVAYSFAQANQAVIRAEKNRVGTAFLRLVEANPDPNLWELEKRPMKRILDPQTGLVREMHDHLYQLGDNVFSVKVNGEPTYITIKHSDLARAMKGLGTDSMNIVVRAMSKLNRYLAMINTQLNPEFIISNFARDLQTAGINLQGTELSKATGRIIKDVGKAIAGANRGLKGDFSTEWAKYYHEFAAAGGKTAFFGLDDVESQKRKLEGLLRDRQRTPGRIAINALKASLGVIDRWNNAVENGIRLSTYVHARRLGASRDRAGSLAKELTVNFNRRGDAGPLMNSLYLFFNASLQGSVRMLQAVRYSKRVRALALSIVVGSMLLAMMNRWIAPDDEDGEDEYSKIPDWVKERNLIIMAPSWWPEAMRPEGGYFKWNMPYGYNVLGYIGTNLEAVVAGAKEPMPAAANIVSSIANAFNPIDQGSSFLSFVTPTIFDPIVDIYLNRDYLGRRIMPEPRDENVPDSQRFWQSTWSGYKHLTSFVNDVSGGNETRPGAIDISPETVEHLVGFATGGIGQLISRTANIGSKLLAGDEVDTDQIPFLRKVVGSKSRYVDRDRYFEIVDAVELTDKEFKKRRDEHDEGAADKVKAEYPAEFSMRRMVTEAEKDRKKLEKLKKKRIAAIKDGEEKAAVEEGFNKRIDEIMLRVRQRYNRLKAEPR